MLRKKYLFGCLLAGSIVISMLLPLQARAASSYYVSPSGSNSNAGTQAQPFQTIQKCLDTAQTGDTCLVMAGTYSESLTIKTSNLVLKNYNGETVTVNSGSSNTIVTSGKLSNITVDGLRLISSKSGGEGSYTVDFTGLGSAWSWNETQTGLGNTNITLQNCYVEGAVYFYGDHNTIQNCELNGNNKLNDGVRFVLASSTNSLTKNNKIHDYLGRAVWINVIADNAYVDGNTIYNTYLGVDCDGAGRPVTNCHVLNNTIYKTGQGSSHTGWGCSVFLEDAFNAVVDGNLLYGSSGADGIYVINYGQGPSWFTDDGLEHRNQDLNAVISNNIIYGNGDAAILSESANGLLIYNNDISGTVSSKATSGTSYNPANFTVKNNIFFGSGSAFNTTPSGTTFANNIYWNASKPSGDSSVSTNPLFVSTSDYHLQSSSPAIDAGTSVPVTDDFDGNTRPLGNGRDIGAYEYTGSSPAPTSTPATTATPRPANTQAATATARPTNTQAATATARPTNTPAASPTHRPTHTPTQTATLAPAPTQQSDVFLQAPTDGSSLLYNLPTFEWNDVGNAIKYNIQISKNTKFKNFIVNATSDTSSFTPPALLSSGKTLYWHVRAVYASGNGPWSAPFSLHTAYPPSVPKLAKPSNNAITANNRPTLIFKKSSIASNAPAFDHYLLQVDRTAAFTNATEVTLQGRTNLQYTFPNDLNWNTTYYWRVVSYNVKGEKSDWSGVRSFHTPLPSPSLLNLRDGSSTSNRTPTFRWTSVDGATNYSIQISKSSSFSTTLVNASVSSSTFLPDQALPAGTLYWRVQAAGTNGPSAWSEMGTFIEN